MSDHIHKLQFVERGGVQCETLGCIVYYSEEHILQILDRLANESNNVSAETCEHGAKMGECWADPRRRINMSEHNPNAWQNGYDDAFYDGIDTSSEMPCKCEACMKAYYEGQGSAMKEISSGWQPAQQPRAADAIRLCACGKPAHFGNSECFECYAGGRGE